MRIAPKRRLWQLHLSTVGLVVIAAGILMFVNFQRQPYGNASAPTDGYECGWPMYFFVVVSETTIAKFDTIDRQHQRPPRYRGAPLIFVSRLLTDFVFWFGLIVALIFIAEYRIRGREGRKT